MPGNTAAEVLQNIWDAAQHFCRHNAAQRIAQPLKSLWSSVWHDLENEGQRLISTRPVDSCDVPLDAASNVNVLADLVHLSKKIARGAPVACNLPSPPSQVTSSEVVKIASLNPGHAGCTDVKGRCVNLNIFHDCKTGILQFLSNYLLIF